MIDHRQDQVPMVATADERSEMVAVAAYYLAEHRGFVAGNATDDWLKAEQQIDHMLETVRRQGISRSQFERTGLRNALRLWHSPQSK
ncbi:DUF2934 domain-containing protein [Halochromatium roseum]|uniref:DUF2934 domain-containing protein n=1 Tax=Halochromatium roseum TaxID=391920 RepID=UPI001913A8CF|nr:DUF2934 domain-containing protein [Halochromatium roseum]MBK5940195.1 hypothetical protein [Halochromatium roseum]